MALSDAIAALFGWRRVVVYDHSIVATTIQGMDAYTMYRKQPALRAVVSFLADNVAGIPLKCYERRGDADRPRDTESDLARLLACPCRGMTTHELVRAILSDYLLAGDALCYMYDDADAPSGRWLRYIPWSWVCGKETLDGFEPSAYRVSNPYTGHRADLPAEDCIRFFSYDPRGTMDSSSAIEALKDVLSEQLSAWEYRNGVWKNGGRVSQWISRPANAPWEPGARERFAKSWKARFAGKDATDTGGTPLLEDGMRLETTTFNAREAQWQEATRLAREDVAAVYHVNPSLIWHTDGQTYASAKDNARALYADTLTPLIDMVEERLNAFLVPMLDMDPATHYCEFDLSSKLAASFEEQAGVLQSSVGGPFMLRNEARAKMNLPAIEGGDELIVPLNVTEGGLASPRDTDPTTERYNAKPALDVKVEPMAKGGDAAPFGDGAPKVAVTLLKTSSEPPEDSVTEIEGVLRRLLERQARRVFADLRAGEAASKSRKAADDYPWWWDMLRWDRELGDDLEPLFRQLCDLRGMAAMADIEEPTSAWDSRRTANFVHAMAERRAHLFNEGTMQQLAANMLEFDVGDPDAISAAERSFLDHAQNRAVRGALTFATAVCGFATKEAVRQVYPRDTDTVRRTKTWRHHGSKQPRNTHAAMDGETVGLDERFSNGADYPGDLGLPAEETVNCHCTIDVGVKRRDKVLEPNLRVSRSESPIMQAENFDELNKMCEERLGGSLARSVESMNFESVRMVAAGLDDVRMQFGINGQFMMEMSAADLGTKTLARVTDTAGVIINSRFMKEAQEWAVTLGRHEGGHLLEVYLSKGDTERFDSGKDAARILRRAFKAYGDADPQNCPSRLQRAVFLFSSVPSDILAKTGKKALFNSEALAEATERAVGPDGDRTGMLPYVIESIGVEFRR